MSACARCGGEMGSMHFCGIVPVHVGYKPTPYLSAAPAPWTPERRERVGRAAFVAKMRALGRKAACDPVLAEAMWRCLDVGERITWECAGEAAARADEGER